MNLKEKIHTIIFEAETPAGRAFDITLMVLIVMSVFVVMLETIPTIHHDLGFFFRFLEWLFTILFTIEFFLRVYCVRSPLKYIFSFYGMVDFLAILPTYLSLFLGGTQSLLVIRSLRLLRVFRVFKLGRYLGEADQLKAALRASGPKITVFLGSVLALVLIAGAVMYLIEGEENGFTSVPRGMYWSIVTLTTVGYGDLTPQTPFGQFLASVLMIFGYGILAVPTGIVSVELARVGERREYTRSCANCSKEGHLADSIYCRFCGERL